MSWKTQLHQKEKSMSLKVEKGLFQQKLTWWPSKVQVKEEEKLQAIKLYLQDVYYILQKDNNRGVVFCCPIAIQKIESN